MELCFAAKIWLVYDLNLEKKITLSFLVRTAISLSLSSICPFSLSLSLSESDNLKVGTVRVIS